MQHILVDQESKFMRNDYFAIRSKSNPSCDEILCVTTLPSISPNLELKIYKKILKFEGEYRHKVGNWSIDKIKMKII